MTRVVRSAFILWVILRYGLDELVLSSFQRPWLHRLSRVLTIGRKLDAPRGQRLRQALERLGPIFVKFGQVMSTRRDLLPPDVADELAKLQDRVPPFDSAIAVATIERAFRRPIGAIFDTFEREPVASASIAQVHFATLKDRQGHAREVAVKVLRPGMLPVIEKDLALMRMMAGWIGSLSADAKRLKPREVVAKSSTSRSSSKPPGVADPPGGNPPDTAKRARGGLSGSWSRANPSLAKSGSTFALSTRV